MRKIKDYKIPKYRVKQKDLIPKKTKRYRMTHYLATEASFYPIPGLTNTSLLDKKCTTMVPQGICTCENYTLTTAYDSEGIHLSAIYVLENNSLIATLVYDNKSHLGGIAYDGSYIWVAEGGGSAHGDEMGAIKKEDFFSAIKMCIESKAESIQLANIIRLRAKELKYTSFCSYHDGILWAGHFSAKTTSHIYGYKACEENGQLFITPVRYIEAPMKTQGICFYAHEDTTYLGVSTSYGRRNNSVFRCYKLKNYNNPSDTYENIPQIRKNSAYRTIILPSMSEQICVKDNTIYCIFESAAYKYLRNSSRPIGSYCIFDAEKVFLSC